MSNTVRLIKINVRKFEDEQTLFPVYLTLDDFVGRLFGKDKGILIKLKGRQAPGAKGQMERMMFAKGLFELAEQYGKQDKLSVTIVNMKDLNRDKLIQRFMDNLVETLEELSKS